MQDENLESVRVLKERIIDLEMEICDYQVKTAALEAKYAVEAAEKVRPSLFRLVCRDFRVLTGCDLWRVLESSDWRVPLASTRE